MNENTNVLNTLLQPMLMAEILDMVMHYVDYRDLRNCRLVCQDWEVAARKQLQVKSIMEPLSYMNTDIKKLNFIKTFDIKKRYVVPTSILVDIRNERSLETILKVMKFLEKELRHVYLNLTSRIRKCSKFLKLQNFGQCEILQIHYKEQPILDIFSQPILLPKLTELTIDLNNLNRYMNSIGQNSYYAKLINNSPNLRKLWITLMFTPIVREENFDENMVYMENIKFSLIELVQKGDLKQLKNLGLFISYKAGDIFVNNLPKNSIIAMLNVCFDKLIPSCFKLESLHLQDIYSNSLYNFIAYHKSTLRQLDIKTTISRTYCRPDYHCAYPIPELPVLRNLCIPYYYGERNNLMYCNLAAMFPKLRDLQLTGLLLICARASPQGLQYEFLEESYNNSVTTLKLQCSFSKKNICLQENNLLKLCNQFMMVKELELLFVCGRFLSQLIQNGDGLDNLTTLIIRSGEIYAVLDSELMGFSDKDCKQMQKIISSSDTFSFDNFNLMSWQEICADSSTTRITNGIERFQSLQRLELDAVVVHCALLAYIIKHLTNLTALRATTCRIKKDFLDLLMRSVKPGVFNWKLSDHGCCLYLH